MAKVYKHMMTISPIKCRYKMIAWDILGGGQKVLDIESGGFRRRFTLDKLNKVHLSEQLSRPTHIMINLWTNLEYLQDEEAEAMRQLAIATLSKNLAEANSLVAQIKSMQVYLEENLIEHGD